MGWQTILRENIIELEELEQYLEMTDQEKETMKEILRRFPMSVPKYYLSLIDPNDPNDPIKKMCIPSTFETDLNGSFDTSGESINTIVRGIQHKYDPTILALTTSMCAMYCRHCFRKRLVGLDDNDDVIRDIHSLVKYVEEHPEVTNVLISGGDSFLNTDEVIETYLKDLIDIPYLDLIRFGTRVPVVLPQRITEDQKLQEILKKYNAKKQIYVVTQFNHPREITKESGAAIQALLETGVALKNQTVLLKGVNDDPAILAELLKQLTRWGIAPYYVFQCRPVRGVKNQFQVPLRRGAEIIKGAKNLQNGIGKSFRYVMSHETGKIEILGINNRDEVVFQYHQAKYEQDVSRIFTLPISDDLAWLGEVPQ